MAKLAELVKKVVGYAKEYWPILSGFGFGAYVLVAWKRVTECLATPCSAWIGLPAIVLGGILAVGGYRALLRRRREPLAIVPALRGLHWSEGASAGLSLTA